MISNGIDLINNNRFEKLKKNTTFMNKTFNKSELEYIKKANYSLETIAGLYVSKEAFLKNIKKGINNYSLLDIEVFHDNNNAPYIKLNGQLKKTYQNLNMSLSISHDSDYAIAIVTLIK